MKNYKMPGNTKKPRILVYGAGAIGSIFAGKLSKIGADVTILARNQRYAELSKNGLILKKAATGEEETFHLSVIDNLSDADIYDYVIVAVQFTQIDEILPVLAKNKSPNIVFTINNPCGYQKWIEAVGYERILLGFPSAGGGRKGGKVIYFIGTGIIKVIQSTTFGELNGKNSARLKTLMSLFKSAGFSPARCGNMEAFQKTHVAFIIPICKALCKFDADNYRLAKSYRTIRMMILYFREQFRILHFHKIPITPAKLHMLYLPLFLLTPVFMLFMNTKGAEVALAGHVIVAKAEIDALENEFDKLSDASGIQTPAANWFARNNNPEN